MLLEVHKLNTFYGASHVLQGISLSVDEGRIVSLLGRNGMGKSTTLKSIMGLVKPRSGVIQFKGRNIAGHPPHQVARIGIGYVPEERAIFPTLSVLDNLLLGIKAGRAGKTGTLDTWSLERIYEHFPILKELKTSKGVHLSGGEQQMLTIARTLMGNPELLLVDEPTEGLAPLMVLEVRNVLVEINKGGVSILLVEHNLKMALSLANRIYLMGKAHIGFEGTREELEARPDVRAKYLEV
ncbi:MAG TPA: ABC transporter ATP-binding protein [Thermodesulfobacteriota bacterium]|nr:ABC transporter ATP-binding protein [Thermodesulfobacteriota bacterium]